MSSPIKISNTSGDYTITCADGTGTFKVNAANILFNGNVTQIANSITTADFITVAANNTGSINNMGLLAQANTTSYAGFRFSTTSNTWQISSRVNSDGSAIDPYQTLAAGNVNAAGSNTQIQFNELGVFGATSNFTFDYANNRLTLTGSQALVNIGTPANVANAVVLYSNAVGVGGTGLYFTSSSAQDELISKTKAITYSIIF